MTTKWNGSPAATDRGVKPAAAQLLHRVLRDGEQVVGRAAVALAAALPVDDQDEAAGPGTSSRRISAKAVSPVGCSRPESGHA